MMPKVVTTVPLCLLNLFIWTSNLFLAFFRLLKAIYLRVIEKILTRFYLKICYQKTKISCWSETKVACKILLKPS